MEDRKIHSLRRYLNLIEATKAQDNVMLIGSWAEFAYMTSGILPGFTPDIRTLDVDFLIRNKLRPADPVSLTAVAKSNGFSVMADRITSCTKIYDENGLEAEFLISKVGAGVEVSLKTNVGVVAQSLRYLDILSCHPIQVDLFGMRVLVPEPEAYFVHKLVVNSERGEKVQKDIRALGRLFPFLREDRIDEISTSLGKKGRRRYDDARIRFDEFYMQDLASYASDVDLDYICSMSRLAGCALRRSDCKREPPASGHDL